MLLQFRRNGSGARLLETAGAPEEKTGEVYDQFCLLFPASDADENT